MNNKIVNSPYEAEFETHSRTRKIADYLLLPILNNIPGGSRALIKKTHDSAKEVMDHKTTHRALENLYKSGEPEKSKNSLQSFFHRVWFSTANSKAVRNRLKIVRSRINEELKTGSTPKERSVLSIASGSARAVIEAVDALDLENKNNLKLYFLDKNPHALTYSKQLAKNHNIDASKCTWEEGTAATFLRKEVAKGSRFNLVEMVGLLDYFDDEKAVEIFSLVEEVLAEGGAFITANIAPNKEQKFVTKVVDWKMIYRTPEELENLLIKSGFKKENMIIDIEPFGIHTVITAIKKP